MPLQNRVDPEGNIVATRARGTIYGNRGGCFHRDDGSLKLRPYATKQWICCVLEFKNRKRVLRQPGRFTELFFLDEATAFAAGHRPCFECRRADAEHFASLWNAVHRRSGRAAAPAMDEALQTQRIDGTHTKIVSRATTEKCPDGTMVRTSAGPALIWRGQAYPWSFEGYGRPKALNHSETVTVLTPPAICAILALGFIPKLHPSIPAK